MQDLIGEDKGWDDQQAAVQASGWPRIRVRGVHWLGKQVERKARRRSFNGAQRQSRAGNGETCAHKGNGTRLLIVVDYDLARTKSTVVVAWTPAWAQGVRCIRRRAVGWAAWSAWRKGEGREGGSARAVPQRTDQ
jgi:hypothetical protein